MDEQLPPAVDTVDQPRPGILHRRSSRRALLIGSATLAAGGAAIAVVSVAAQSGPEKKTSTVTNVASDGGAAATTAAPAAAKTAAALSSTPITDARKRAAHLLRRAGFGGSAAEIEAFSALSREEAASRLVDFEKIDNAALEKRIAAANLTLRYGPDARGQAIQDMQRWWLMRMAYTARPLEERMTFIWHGLLTSQVTKVGPQRSYWLVVQNELFRAHALGKYDDLVQAVAKDPAMMTYLDTVESTKEHPNENFPREVMELFTMGVGAYTEDDIRESSRAFTGWRLSAPDRPVIPANATEAQKKQIQLAAIAAYDPAYRFQARLHDDGQKTFLGKTGNWGGEDILKIIMEQPATGRFITTRLFREFAYDNPEPAVIDRLVKVWNSSGHDTREVVRSILTSDEFYSEKAYFAKVRSPIEMIVGVIRGLELESAFELASGGRGKGSGFYAGMDQVLFEPPNVAGWPGGTAWLSSSTFFARANFLDQVFFARGKSTIVPALKNAATPETLVDEAARRLIDSSLPDPSRSALVAHLTTIKDAQERAATAAYLLAGSPEFQLI